MPPNIVAFLQNQWFREPDRASKILALYENRKPEEGREQFIRDFLFFGCLTGKRLRAAFGEELCGEIVWEEVSPKLGGKASSVFPADRQHIRRVIAKHQPGLVIAFGKVAADGIGDLVDVPILYAPHPAARGPATVPLLLETAAQVREFIKGSEVQACLTTSTT